jgi:type IV secretory pathway VirJ component
MKLLLAHLGTTLLKLHRELLQYQAQLAAKDDQCEYTAYDLLKLSINDPRFSWLRQYSDLIIQIDIITDDKKNAPFDAHSLVKSVKKVIAIDQDPSPEFIRALKTESSFMLSLGLVRKALIDVEAALSTETN